MVSEDFRAESSNPKSSFHRWRKLGMNVPFPPPHQSDVLFSFLFRLKASSPLVIVVSPWNKGNGYQVH